MQCGKELFQSRRSVFQQNHGNEILIRGKSTRDLELPEMLDIIYASQVGDVSLNYLGFDSHFRQIFYCYFELMSPKNGNISSHYEKAEKGAIEVLDKLYAQIIENQAMNNGLPYFVYGIKQRTVFLPENGSFFGLSKNFRKKT